MKVGFKVGKLIWKIGIKINEYEIWWKVDSKFVTRYPALVATTPRHQILGLNLPLTSDAWQNGTLSIACCAAIDTIQRRCVQVTVQQEQQHQMSRHDTPATPGGRANCSGFSFAYTSRNHTFFTLLIFTKENPLPTAILIDDCQSACYVTSDSLLIYI